ncbi:MAG: tRNA (pseudouridine(54)-N(1))-methyltransferase TrmY [Thermoplasmatota archaeon]
MAHFLIVGHRATTAANLSLDDLPAAGGRLDILARTVGASLVVSHGLRAGATATLLLLGPPHAPRAVRFSADHLRHFNPDERSTAALIRRALGTPVTGRVWQEATPGVEIAKMDFEMAVNEIAGHARATGGGVHVLEESGPDVRLATVRDADAFVVGDHEGFTPQELETLQSAQAHPLSVGPRSLHAEHAVVVLWNELDRRGTDAAGLSR